VDNTKPPSKPTVLDYTVKSKPMDRSFTKACIKICLGSEDQVTNATITSQFHKDILANKGTYKQNDKVKLIGKQPSPFSFLAIISPIIKWWCSMGFVALMSPSIFCTNMMETSWHSAMMQAKPEESPQLST